MRVKRLLKVGLLFCLTSSLIHAEDAGHNISGASLDSPLEQEIQKYDVNDSPYFGRDDALEKSKKDSKKNSPFLIDRKLAEPDPNIKEDQFDTGFTNPGSFEKTNELIEYKYEDLLKSFRGKSSEAFSFVYLVDNYTYDDNRNAFERTFSGDPDDINGGVLQISVDKYFFRRTWVNLSWGVNAGVGFNSGKGVFVSDGVKSDTTFKLWTLPLDLALSAEIPLGKWLKIGLSGGPSALGLIQRRDDRDDNDPDKVKRQVGTGFFGAGRLKISLTHFMPKESLEMHQQYKLTNMLLNLEVRFQNYANFSDNIEITGASFGAGLTFEFL